MDKLLSPHQKAVIPHLIVEILKGQGKTIADLGGDVNKGDPKQIEHAGFPVWHDKSDIDEQVAKALHLPPSLWGPQRESNNLPINTRRALARLGRQGIVAVWNPRRASRFRLVDGSRRPVSKPITRTSASADLDVETLFMAIVSKSSRDGTYKFVLAKTLLDYCKGNAPESRKHSISYDYLAGKFLKHYWHQKYRFRMRQQTRANNKGLIAVQILESVFGDDPPSRFEDLDREKVERARQMMLEEVLASASSYRGNVIHRFQRIGKGDNMKQMSGIYYNNEAEKKITLKPDAHAFLRRNYVWLERALVAEWASYLERANPGLPRLVSKLSRLYASPAPTKHRAKFLLAEKSPHCFYCERGLKPSHASMNHFIPWPYVFDDHVWNVVIACRDCNRGKGDLLAPTEFVDRLIERNDRCTKTMQIMRTSLSHLSPRGDWKTTVRGHYAMCGGFGFEKWAS